MFPCLWFHQIVVRDSGSGFTTSVCPFVSLLCFVFAWLWFHFTLDFKVNWEIINQIFLLARLRGHGVERGGGVSV